MAHIFDIWVTDAVAMSAWELSRPCLTGLITWITVIGEILIGWHFAINGSDGN